MRSHLPFSTREVLATISSPLRVCLTPWSVFQDGWRHPISFANIEHHGEETRLAASSALPFFLRPFHQCPHFCNLVALWILNPRRKMLRGWFWPLLKWRYFHCHCHDFRFYVTLFPKCFSNFRSRYLFDIGLPTLYLTLADTYLPLDTAIPNSATLLSLSNGVLGLRGSNGLTPSLAQYSHEGLYSAMGLLCCLNFATPAPNTRHDFCHNSRPCKTRFGNEFGPSSLAAD